MRLLWPALPSLSPLLQGESESYWAHENPPVVSSPDDPTCSDSQGSFVGGTAHVAPPPRTHTFGSGSEAVRVLLVGDSVAWGWGVEPEETYGYQLGRGLGEALERPVTVVIAGIPGGGFCDLVRAAHRSLDESAFDLVVYQVFADDLEKRAMLLLDDKPLAFPDTVTHPLGRGLVSHSYLANWFWSQALVHTGLPKRYIDAAGQESFTLATGQLQRRLSEAEIPGLFFLLPPTGLATCSASDSATEESWSCTWFEEDMVLMKGMLEAEGIPVTDLRQIYRPGERLFVEAEARRFQEDPRALPIHPDPEGHLRIAQRLQPLVQEILAARRSP